MAAQKGTKSVLDYIRANCPKVCDQLISDHAPNYSFQSICPPVQAGGGGGGGGGKGGKGKGKKGKGKGRASPEPEEDEVAQVLHSSDRICMILHHKVLILDFREN